MALRWRRGARIGAIVFVVAAAWFALSPVDLRALLPSRAAPPGRQAFVTLLYGGSHNATLRVCVLAESIRIMSNFELVVMVTPDVPAVALETVAQHAPTIVHVPPINLPFEYNTTKEGPRRFSLVFTKLRAWTLTQYSRLVFVDSDAFVKTSEADDLFSFVWCPEGADLCAVPDKDWRYRGLSMLNTGVMVLRPSARRFEEFEASLLHGFSETMLLVDQEFLSAHVRGMKWRVYALPPRFNSCSQWIHRRAIVHYCGDTKLDTLPLLSFADTVPPVFLLDVCPPINTSDVLRFQELLVRVNACAGLTESTCAGRTDCAFFSPPGCSSHVDSFCTARRMLCTEKDSCRGPRVSGNLAERFYEELRMDEQVRIAKCRTQAELASGFCALVPSAPADLRAAAEEKAARVLSSLPLAEAAAQEEYWLHCLASPPVWEYYRNPRA